MLYSGCMTKIVVQIHSLLHMLQDIGLSCYHASRRRVPFFVELSPSASSSQCKWCLFHVFSYVPEWRDCTMFMWSDTPPFCFLCSIILLALFPEVTIGILHWIMNQSCATLVSDSESSVCYIELLHLYMLDISFERKGAQPPAAGIKWLQKLPFMQVILGSITSAVGHPLVILMGRKVPQPGAEWREYSSWEGGLFFLLSAVLHFSSPLPNDTVLFTYLKPHFILSRYDHEHEIYLTSLFIKNS